MISRRNIRIKAMQSIYSLIATNQSMDVNECTKTLINSYEETQKTLLTILLFAKKICEYTIIDANKKSKKYLPTSADLNVNTKLSNNLIVNDLRENKTFQTAIDKYNIAQLLDNNIVQEMYNIIIQSQEYTVYTAIRNHELEADKKFFKYILKTINTNEDADGFLENLFTNFEENKESIIIWFDKYFNQMATINFTSLLAKDKEQFGLELVETFIEKHEYTASLVHPKLINWDAERIAYIDMIVMQMGVVEFLYFPTIPTKVTINEYIDIAKLYGNMQSGQFINGVLDKICKDLEKDNKIYKTELQKK